MSDNTCIEALKATYEPKIRALLEEIHTEIGERDGLTCTHAEEMTDETYRWSVSIRRKGGDIEDSVDVSIEIAESEVYDGHENGLNFTCDVVHYEGQIIGGLSPYNYTSEVWVPCDDKKAVEARWCIFQGAFDHTHVVDSIEEFYAKKAA